MISSYLFRNQTNFLKSIYYCELAYPIDYKRTQSTRSSIAQNDNVPLCRRRERATLTHRHDQTSIGPISDQLAHHYTLYTLVTQAIDNRLMERTIETGLSSKTHNRQRENIKPHGDDVSLTFLSAEQTSRPTAR